MHLVEIETLTKEDIDELVNAGRLDWWERKKAKMEKAKLEAEALMKAEEEAKSNETVKETVEVTSEVVEEVKEETPVDTKEE